MTGHMTESNAVLPTLMLSKVSLPRQQSSMGLFFSRVRMLARSEVVGAVLSSK